MDYFFTVQGFMLNFFSFMSEVELYIHMYINSHNSYAHYVCLQVK